MSFLFGKKSKPPPSALPAATREITSSHGPAPQPASLNGAATRDISFEKNRAGAQSQTPTPGGSVNNSLSSLQNQGLSSTPEPKALRERAEPNGQNAPARIAAGPSPESPYPWSSRRLNFTAGNPFPRYGAAINATASKDGTIYLMGGLVGGATVKGDLWLTEMGNGSLACYPISTTGDGPGPRVGHASLLVGNAFIGPRPTGRYGHTLNILGSKIYIFGGQVEGFFFNDLVAFDLNSLQSSASRWEVLLPNTKDQVSPQTRAPPARTNHSVVTWNDKLYLFGGTDGVTWFNDVWTYEPRSNSWTELDCIGYIPVAREGHSAALVNDTMYIFGGRTQEGVDLGDLAAFRISSRRWYMFQNMGHSPSARSGHSMTSFGKHVVVLAGEPSSSVADRNELSLGYILDTSKIRYPPNENGPPQQAQNPQRKLSGGEKGVVSGKAASPPTRESMMPGQQQTRAPDGISGAVGGVGSRLPRAAGQQPPGPPPMQQPPQPRMNGPNPQFMANGRAKTPTKNDRVYGPPIDTGAAVTQERENFSPTARDSPSVDVQRKASDAISQRTPKESIDTTRSASIVSRNASRSHRQHPSQESMEHSARQSLEAQHQRGPSRDVGPIPVDSGVGASPAVAQHNDELARELETVKSRNAWYASELVLARKAGYNPGSSTSPVFDERSAEAFREEDKPLLEALLKMKAELERVQASIAAQGEDAARRIAEVERQRDAAVNEAIYAKTKLAAHGGGSHNGTPQPDAVRNAGTPDMDRMQDMNRRLAASLAAQAETATKLEQLTHQIEAERKAKQLAEETAEAAQKRVQELDSTRQKATAESERLRAELHEAERVAREVSTSAAEAETSSKLLAIDKQELTAKVARISEEARTHANLLQNLRDAVFASSEKSTLLEKKLEDEQTQSEGLRQKLAQLRAEHEAQVVELETAFGTPELNRVRELEQQVDSMNKTHEELRAVFEQREHEVSKEWEEKLQALHNDHQAAVKYLRGTEKMLAKMKQELDRYKTANTKLEEELNQTRQDHGLAREQTAGWEAERTALRNTQESMKATVAHLEDQLSKMQTDLATAREQAQIAAQDTRQAESAASQTRADLETLRRQYALVEERAREAESRVQIFLDQFESSVDNYRRQSQVPTGSTNGAELGRRATHDSVASAESLYSHQDESNNLDAPNRPSSATNRNSMALDNLASELDALRSHWETTNKAYRLSDRFEFEPSVAGDHNDGSESPTHWEGMMTENENKQKAPEKKDIDFTRSDSSTVGGAPGLPVA
ncbi:hypothetical protein T440DRAFT_383350 [Plenodomus tracheiphilus IPT5]|uniref:Cell polarity protein-like protein n=1 Tax=Plenodomus tracheiphilus IPT5 TaxID=1408161 RepID=A0A6A7BMK6_9PLEO|nr:hypothetical protein T440DRAFT_383350 [Plenodomus tracheiphilus IPT5]